MFYLVVLCGATKTGSAASSRNVRRKAIFYDSTSRKLNTVEGNTVFYALPSEEAIKHWVKQTQEGFRFCPKVSRSVSHAPILRSNRATPGCLSNVCVPLEIV